MVETDRRAQPSPREPLRRPRRGDDDAYRSRYAADQYRVLFSDRSPGRSLRETYREGCAEVAGLGVSPPGRVPAGYQRMLEQRHLLPPVLRAEDFGIDPVKSGSGLLISPEWSDEEKVVTMLQAVNSGYWIATGLRSHYLRRTTLTHGSRWFRLLLCAAEECCAEGVNPTVWAAWRFSAWTHWTKSGRAGKPARLQWILKAGAVKDQRDWFGSFWAFVAVEPGVIPPNPHLQAYGRRRGAALRELFRHYRETGSPPSLEEHHRIVTSHVCPRDVDATLVRARIWADDCRRSIKAAVLSAKLPFSWVNWDAVEDVRSGAYWEGSTFVPLSAEERRREGLEDVG